MRTQLNRKDKCVGLHRPLNDAVQFEGRSSLSREDYGDRVVLSLKKSIVQRQELSWLSTNTLDKEDTLTTQKPNNHSGNEGCVNACIYTLCSIPLLSTTSTTTAFSRDLNHNKSPTKLLNASHSTLLLSNCWVISE